MSQQIFFSSVLIFITIVQFLIAGYIFLLNPKVPANITMAALLLLFSTINLANIILQGTFSLQEANFWIIIYQACLNALGPVIYLTSVAILRPQWLRKYRGGYGAVTGFIFVPLLILLADATGLSKNLFGNILLYSIPPSANLTTENIISPLAGRGSWQTIFLGIQIGFQILTALCPALVVTWKDRKLSPRTSQNGFFFFLSVLISIVFEGSWITALSVPIRTTIVSLIFLFLLAYITLSQSSLAEQTRKLQINFGRWPVYAKLIGAIIVINLVMVFAIAVTNFTVLRINSVQSAGENLSLLGTAETRNLANELLFQSTKLQELTQNDLILSALALQNELYRIKSPETILSEMETRELAWQTSDEQTLTTRYLLRYPPSYEALNNFREVLPDHLLVYVTDKHGAIVTGTKPPERYNSAPTNWWQAAHKNEVTLYISAPLYNALENRYYTEIAIPIFDRSREVIGVLYTEYNLQPLLEHIAAIQIGETGDAALFNSLGLRLPDSPGLPLVDTALDWNQLNASAQPWHILPYLGQDSLLVWADVGMQVQEGPISNLRWRLVFSQSLTEVLTTFNQINSTSLLILLGTVFLSLILAILISRIIAYPLNDLAQTATLISKGSLEIRAEEITDDEFGLLARSFNVMTSQLQALITGLETQVADRTQTLEQRARQIQAAVEVGNTVASIREIDSLLTQVTHLISQRFGFYHAGIFLLSEDGEYAVLRAANSVGGQRMLARSHQLKVGEVGIVGFVASRKLPRIALDTGQDAVFFNNPDLPETRSELGLPLISAGTLLGVLDVQSTQAAAFAQEDISILQLLADQLAVAIDNANLFTQNQINLAETQMALESTRRAYRDLSREGWQDLAREATLFAYRADPKGLTLVREQLPPSLKVAAREGAPLLAAQDTLAIPIKIHDHVAGVMQLKKGKKETWSTDEVNLITALTDQLGTAIESARLYKETQTTLVRTEALYQVGRAAIAFENTEQLLQSVADTVAGTLPAYQVLIANMDFPGEKVLYFIENNAKPQEITPELFPQLMDGLTGWAIRTRKIILSPKNLPDPRESVDAQKYRREQNLGAIMVVPMFYQDTTLGTITAINTQDERDFSKDDADLLTAMANQLAAALINTELLAQTRRRALQLQTSAEISQAASSILELDQLLPQAVELIRERFSLYYVGIFLVEETKTWAVLRAGTGEAGRIQIEQGHQLAVGGDSMIGQCVLTNQARIALDVGSEATHFQNPHLPKTRSEMALPLTSRTGTIGALTVQSILPAAFTEDDLRVFQTMAEQLASAIDNAILFETDRRRLQVSGTLLEITQVAGTSLRLNQVLREITLRTAKVTEAYRCMVYLIDDNHYIQPVMAQFADGHTDPKQWELFQSLTSDFLLNVPLFANTIQTRQPILVTNIQEKPDLIPRAWVKPFHTQTILTVPLISQDRGIGILVLDQISPIHTFNQEQIDLASTIAGQTAALIQNARLFQEQGQRAEELRQLNQFSLELSQLQMDLAPSLNTLTKRTMELLNADGSGVWLWREEDQDLELAISFQKGESVHIGQRLKPGKGLAGIAFATRQLQNVDDYMSWEGRASEFEKTPFHAALAAPLIQQNEGLGVLVITRSQSGKPFSRNQQNLAFLLANQAASYIRTARLFQQTQEALAREQYEHRIASILAGAAEKLGAAYGEAEILQVLVQEIQNVVQPDHIVLYEWRDEHNAFEVTVRRTPVNAEDDYTIGQLIQAENRPELWKAFGARDAYYNVEHKKGGLVHEQYIFPWMSGNLACGIIELHHRGSSLHLREQNQEAIRGIMRQAAVAIQSARLFEQTQDALTRTEALFQVSQAAAAVESLPVLLQSIVDRVAESLPADRVLLLTLDLERKQVTSFVESGLPTGSIVPLTFDELMRGLTGWVIEQRKPALSLKGSIDDRETEEVRQHRLDAGSGSIMVVPLIYRDETLGTITATNDLDSPDFSNQDVTLLTAMANQAAAAIENARLITQTQRRALQLQTAAEVSRAASSILDLNQLLPQVVELIQDRFSLYYVGIFLVDEPRRYAVLRAGSGEAGRIQIEQGHRLRLNTESMIGRCVLETKPQIVQEIGAETTYFRNPNLPETRSEMALPLQSSGKSIGAMTIQSAQPAAFTPDDITVLQTLADQLAIAIENARFVANTRIRAENERLLNQITAQLSQSLDLDNILQTAVKEIAQISKVREVAIHIGEMEAPPNGDDDFLTESQQGLRMHASEAKAE